MMVNDEAPAQAGASSAEHREIDLQRHMTEGRLLYQSLCLCGFRSELGSRASAQRGLKRHRLLEEWLADRPQIIKDLARSHPPDGEYRLANGLDNDLYVVYSYHEDGTITVIRYARLAGAPDSVLPLWKVFGMKPEDLVRIDE